MSLVYSAEQIGAHIAARVAGCTVANGAETDLGVKVYRGRRKLDDEMFPCSTLLEGEDVADQAEGRRRADVKVTRTYTVDAYLPCNPNDPNLAAHAAIRDLKRALFRTDGKADSTFGGLVASVAYLGSDIGTRADGASFVQAQVRVAVTHVEDLANPQ
jgi:hypothetical protein